MERRQMRRRVPDAAEPIAAMRVRTGGSLVVMNVSDGGALVEGTSRLLPGTHVDVHVVTPQGRLLVRSRVVRAAVSHVASDAMRYLSALMFNHPVDTAPCGYVVPVALCEEPAPAGSDYPAPAIPSESVRESPGIHER